MNRLPYIITILLLMPPSFQAGAAVVRVPSEQPTIQLGIDAASTGDTVLVAAGAYTGDGNRDVDFSGKAVVVKSSGGAAVTAVDCQGSFSSQHRGFLFHGGETSGSVLDGFTITNGYVDWPERGGGISCTGSSPTITGCVLSDNSSPWDGGGICCSDSAAPLIDDCTFTGNDAQYGYGGAVYCLNGSDATISNCTMTGNSSLYGGGVSCNVSAPVASNCFLTGNTADYGGGAYCEEEAARFVNCIFTANTSDWNGAAISCYSYYAECTPEITNCTVSENSSAGVGGALYCYYSDPVVTNTIFWGDSPDEIYVYTGDPIVTYSDIQGSWAGEGNIAEPPFFVTYQGYEYLLHPASPCIDAGDPAVHDFLYDWHPRIPPFYKDGQISDMGAYGGPGNWKWFN